MRHGAAEDPAGDDFSRRLTVEGIHHVRHTCELLVSRGIAVSDLFSSPLVRARQTAGIVAEICGQSLPVTVWSDIAPDGNCQAVSARLGKEAGSTPIVVTHEPFVSRMVEFLCGENVHMDTAMVACISAEAMGQHQGRLEWVIGD